MLANVKSGRHQQYHVCVGWNRSDDVEPEYFMLGRGWWIHQIV